MDWGTWAAAFLSSTVAGSVIAGVLDRYSAQTQARESRYTANVDGARVALGELRTGYLTAVEPQRIIALENRFDAALAQCDSDRLREEGQRYKRAGRAWYAMDPDVNRDVEEAAYEAVQRAMTRRTRRFRPRRTD